MHKAGKRSEDKISEEGSGQTKKEGRRHERKEKTKEVKRAANSTEKRA